VIQWRTLYFPFESSLNHMVTRRRKTPELLNGAEESVQRNPSAEDALRDSQARLHAVLSTEVDAIVVIDEKGSIESVNPAFTRVFGYPPEEVIGENVSLLMPDPYRSDHDQYLATYLASGEQKIIGVGREVEGRRKDATTFPIELSVSEMWLGQRRMFTGIVRDITERKKAEGRFRLAVEAAPNGMVMIDEGGKVVLVNSQTERLFGYARDELIGQSVEILVPERFRAKHVEHRSAFLAAPTARAMGADRELYGLRKDGAEFPVEIGLKPVETAEGTMVLSSVVDITERQQVQEKLRESQRTLSTLMGNLPGMAYRCRNDGDWTIEFASEGCLQLTGYRCSELVGTRTLGQLIHPEDRKRVWNEVQAALEQRESFRLVYRMTTASGNEKWVWEQGCGIFSADKVLVALEGFITDITEQKKTEKKLVEQESLAKLGEMSAIVAHEVKNPLAGISGAARMLKRRLPKDSEESEICEEMISRTEDLSNGVNDILAYSRPRTPKLRSVPVQLLLDDAAAFVAQDPLFEDVDIDLSSPADCLISCDPDMLKPVLLNLFVNAAQAMYGSGRIRVSVDAGNPCCTITVHDSGPGTPSNFTAETSRLIVLPKAGQRSWSRFRQRNKKKEDERKRNAPRPSGAGERHDDGTERTSRRKATGRPCQR
jgi:protein-histidine pros-kinase